MPQTKAQKAAYNARWYVKNRDRERGKMKQRRQKIKDLVFEAYGGYRCTCCGETEKIFLTIDHMNNDGAKHREEIGHRGGIGWYYWLVEHNFPPGFEPRCFNCNLGRAHNGGICPHQEITRRLFMKANPLGHLEMELIQDKTSISSFSSMSGYDDLIRDQVPVKDPLSGADTFKVDASKATSRAKVETDRMHVDGGADLKGVSMVKEFGGDKVSNDFSSDKSK